MVATVAAVFVKATRTVFSEKAHLKAFLRFPPFVLKDVMALERKGDPKATGIAPMPVYERARGQLSTFQRTKLTFMLIFSIFLK
jgi:hypothetical protein